MEEDEIELRDSEGHRFATGSGSWCMYDNGVEYLLFEIDEREALERIRYNDPAYKLSFDLPFKANGARHTFSIPVIEPTATVHDNSLRGDTPVYAIVMLLVFLVGAGCILGMFALVVLAVFWTLKACAAYRELKLAETENV